jgi:retron-type reverse transcriptase
MTHGGRESDRSRVPRKRPHKVEGRTTRRSRAQTEAAEAVEGRERAKGKTGEHTRVRTQCRSALHRALDRRRQAARRDHAKPWTALWHHVYDVNRLREAYDGLNREAAPGVEGQTWAAYGEHLETNLRDLSDRRKRGAYHARPVERGYIPKPDGRQRPIGIPTREDTSVQRATVEVRNAIDEGECRGFSSGCRPGRSPHEALDAVTVGMEKRNGNWVLEADIRGFFGAPGQAWRFQRVRVPPRQGERAAPPGIESWAHGGNDMG